MSVEHVFPSETLAVQSPLEVSLSRSDAVTWRTPYGPRGGRNFAEYPVHSLKVDLGDYGSGSDAAASLYWWDHHIGGPAKSFWLLEPVSRRHRAVVCGLERGDAVQTGFIVPVEATGTINAIFVNGVWQDPTTYTVYTAANTVATNQASNGEDGVTGLTLIGDAASVAAITYAARFGRSAIKVTPDGTNDAISGAYTVVTAAATGVYSYGASYYLNGTDDDIRLSISWHPNADGSGAAISSVDLDSTSNTPGHWIDMYDTNTAPANTLSARLRVIKTNMTSPVFFIGALWFCPGDCSTRPKPFLPSYAPQVIVFNSAAPVLNARVTADFTGQRLWYGARDGDYVSYSVVDTGAVTMGGFKMTEDIPL